MKAFHFRLDRVLDWRKVERQIAAGRVEAAKAALAKARSERDLIQEALHRGPEANPSGAVLANWSGWRTTLLRHLHAVGQRVAAAETVVQKQQAALVEANRRVKLLSNLREAELARWRRDLEREMSAFATDLHLGRLSREKSKGYNRTQAGA